MLQNALICPHAPVMIPSIGAKGGLKGMQFTVNKVLSQMLNVAESQPDVVVIMSQRGYIVPNAISVQIPETEEFFGSMAEFGEEDCVGVKSDNDLATRILMEADNEGLSIIGQNNANLDYGMVIPLYYLQKACKKKFSIVALSMSIESKKTHYEFGEILKKIFAESDQKITFIAASELSHTLSKEAPQGYAPDAKDFDAHVVKYLKAEKIDNFLCLDSFDEDDFFCHGLRPIATLLGAKGDMPLKDISYEAPYGVGYLTALYSYG